MRFPVSVFHTAMPSFFVTFSLPTHCVYFPGSSNGFISSAR